MASVLKYLATSLPLPPPIALFGVCSRDGSLFFQDNFVHYVKVAPDQYVYFSNLKLCVEALEQQHLQYQSEI